MRSRSHRLPIAEPLHDDWVDGSWTVDCICGVTFDDGEEMVDCDECGVWVHTRCSRYVKSEKSFACDKCKNKSKSKSSGGGGGGSSGARNENEETEVAEFLVELPTKTLRMENPNPPAPVASGRPFALWTDIPMEERVHLQGVPGGEPSLFSGIGISSVFGPQLWKSSGYVPKKFNLRYTEFPLLGQRKVGQKEEEDMDTTNAETNSNRADNGARVLFSFLKKNEGPSPVAGDEIVVPRQKKKLDGEKPGSAPVDGRKKKSNSVTVVLNSAKRKKEELGTSKEQNVKKMRSSDKGDVKKQANHGSKAASTFSSDAKHLVFSQDRGCKVVSNDHRHGQNLGDQPLDRPGECATNLGSNEHGLEVAPGNDVSSGKALRTGSKGAQVPLESENCSKKCNGVESLTEVSGPQRLLFKEEVSGDALQTCQAGTRSVGSGSFENESLAIHVRIAGADAKEREHYQESDIDEANSRPVKKLKSELDADDRGDCPVESLHLNDVKLEVMKASTQYPELSVNVATGKGKVVGTSSINTKAKETQVFDASRNLNVDCPRTNKPDESAGIAPRSKRENSGPEVSMAVRKRSSGFKCSSEMADELHKTNGTARTHSTTSYQRKAGVSVLRSNSTTGIMSKSSSTSLIISRASESYIPATAQNSSLHCRQELSDSNQGTKENVSTDKVEQAEKSGRPKKLVKESSRSGSVAKISETTKLSDTSDSKKPSSDPKEPSTHSSSKITLGPDVASSDVSGECASPPPLEGASDMQNKAVASAVPRKAEKSYQSSNNPLARGHLTSMTASASSNVPATLSDEELALLLHHELNSSPRVPRVPRIRQAGSLPQLSGPSASMLMKRTSSIGGKDQGVASRRRTKDFHGEGSHPSQEVENEAKKIEREPISPDNRRQDSSYCVNQLSRKEDIGRAKNTQSMKKTNMNNSISSSADANCHSLSSSRLSSRNTTDDDSRMAGRQTNRTLPGLIAEIMSEGKRMTYEELCNAVLPNWPHLRKHNGERYAYSSHSQAVLDCLRNRSEWARLVDRGPKTSATRKRRKLDADSMSNESEENEDQRANISKDAGSKSFDSHQEDFPKGKRKAINRRQLAFQGNGSMARKRRRADVVSDDESESFSYSSEEDSMSSEEEIQGGGTSVVGSEVSASSEEVQ